jgi:hypothetical protein
MREAKPAHFENTDLFNNHAGLHTCTLRNPENGVESKPDDNNGYIGSRLCDHCGGHETLVDRLTAYDWAGYPDGILLHHRCEGPWFDSMTGRSDSGWRQ